MWLITNFLMLLKCCHRSLHLVLKSALVNCSLMCTLVVPINIFDQLLLKRYCIEYLSYNNTILVRHECVVSFSSSRDYQQYGPKLNAFCDYFVVNYQALVADQPDLSIDDVFGDCTVVCQFVITLLRVHVVCSGTCSRFTLFCTDAVRSYELC